MQTTESIDNLINEKRAVMLYFSAPTCSVCHALKPKLLEAIDKNFSEFEIVSIDISTCQDIAAYYSVFAIPTVLVFLGSKEFLRKSRNMSVNDVINDIKRPYEIMTS